jgi:hypothetical protein
MDFSVECVEGTAPASLSSLLVYCTAVLVCCVSVECSRDDSCARELLCVRCNSTPVWFGQSRENCDQAWHDNIHGSVMHTTLTAESWSLRKVVRPLPVPDQCHQSHSVASHNASTQTNILYTFLDNTNTK